MEIKTISKIIGVILFILGMAIGFYDKQYGTFMMVLGIGMYYIIGDRW